MTSLVFVHQCYIEELKCFCVFLMLFLKLGTANFKSHPSNFISSFACPFGFVVVQDFMGWFRSSFVIVLVLLILKKLESWLTQLIFKLLIWLEIFFFVIWFWLYGVLKILWVFGFRSLVSQTGDMGHMTHHTRHMIYCYAFFSLLSSLKFVEISLVSTHVEGFSVSRMRVFLINSLGRL